MLGFPASDFDYHRVSSTIVVTSCMICQDWIGIVTRGILGIKIVKTYCYHIWGQNPLLPYLGK